MLDFKDIARLEEGRQAVGVREVAREALSVAGGAAGRDAPGSWSNNSVGLPLAGPATDDELDALNAWYTSAGIEPRVDVCPSADPSLIMGLASRGYTVHGFETVFYRELTEDAAPLQGQHADVEILRLDPADDALLREYSRTVAANFSAPDSPSPTT